MEKNNKLLPVVSKNKLNIIDKKNNRLKKKLFSNFNNLFNKKNYYKHKAQLKFSFYLFIILIIVIFVISILLKNNLNKKIKKENWSNLVNSSISISLFETLQRKYNVPANNSYYEIQPDKIASYSTLQKKYFLDIEIDKFWLLNISKINNIKYFYLLNQGKITDINDANFKSTWFLNIFTFSTNNELSQVQLPITSKDNDYKINNWINLDAWFNNFNEKNNILKSPSYNDLLTKLNNSIWTYSNNLLQYKLSGAFQLYSDPWKTQNVSNLKITDLNSTVSEFNHVDKLLKVKINNVTYACFWDNNLNNFLSSIMDFQSLNNGKFLPQVSIDLKNFVLSQTYYLKISNFSLVKLNVSNPKNITSVVPDFIKENNDGSFAINWFNGYNYLSSKIHKKYDENFYPASTFENLDNTFISISFKYGLGSKILNVNSLFFLLYGNFITSYGDAVNSWKQIYLNK